jgi:hypothetical protein
MKKDHPLPLLHKGEERLRVVGDDLLMFAWIMNL